MGSTSPDARFTAADGVIVAAAGAFLVWTAIPGWYRAGGGTEFGIPLPSYSFNAWRGTTMFAALLALVALAWIGLRVGGARVPAASGLVDPFLAGLGLVLTVLGTVVRPATGPGRASPSWAIVVAILVAAVWVYGAVWRYQGGGTTAASSSPGSGFGSEASP